MQASTVKLALVYEIHFTLWIGNLISRSIELMFSYTLRCMASQYLNEAVLWGLNGWFQFEMQNFVFSVLWISVGWCKMPAGIAQVSW